MHRQVTSSATLLRWAKPSAASRSPAMRCFSSYGNAHLSSKRDMQTATAYRPHTLPSSFPPPSRTGGLASISADFPLPGGSPQTSPSQVGAPQNNLHGVDAQTSASTTGTTTTSKTGKPRRPLRARKAAMKLSALATEQLRKLMDQPEPKFIRVGVKNRGCSGLAYHLEYVDKPAKFDEVVEQDGVKVLIDSKALFSIIGSEMDWHEDKLSRRFIFRNPNIKEECGCGESFMV
ncbi:uncharacterized protein N7483_008690 [Penicillium malachiteum]|uniref:uncharacterized protein n=1 Tax=Penicillium malachiteum TaxID=1324776 RepID=UPI00254910B8|nr:uncharacterized protein N7483_008690 [Penicillium malachiteum]KAJ5720756.1 hypothetical protein N7483_008690 [Penicillium malachiteum]